MTKKLKTICCAVALLATTAATPALSQSKNFAGPSLAVTGAFVSNTVKTNYNDGDVSFPLATMGDNDIAYGLDLSYAIPVDNNFLVGLGLTYGLNKTDSGDLLGIIKLQAKDSRSIYIQPTYVINNSFAAFAKLGYHEIKGIGTSEGGGFSEFNEDEEEYGILAGSTTEKYRGTGYGFGLKGLINQNIYLQAEVQYVDYKAKGGGSGDDAVKFNPESVSGIISIGYKF
jgi:opacity protein-like surface antigen